MIDAMTVPAWVETLLRHARFAEEHGLLSRLLVAAALPEMQLDFDLIDAWTPAALALRKRHHNAEFDASVEESEARADSAEGQETMRALIKK